MRQMRHVVWGGAFVATAAVLAVAVRNGELGDATILATVLGFGISATTLALDLARTPASGTGNPPPTEVMDALTAQLAEAVEQQWRAEWRLRRLQDPEPLTVHWSSAEPWLADPQDPDTDGRRLDDRLENIAAVLERTASRRLVVLGEPGSGKTVLAIRFALDVLAHRAPGAAVPVVASMSDWRPQSESLDAWLARYIADHYPGASWARDLLDAGRVIPVLDGLDEMPPPLRIAAVRRLNADLDDGRPLLLTCRTAAYADIVRSSDVFTSAAVVELQPLDFETAAGHLLRTARPVRGPGGSRTTRWHPVIERLRADPDARACATLRAVLGTPLMVTLARTAYEDTDAGPSELLDDSRWSDQAQLEAHLLDALVPAAFRDDTSRLDRTLGSLGFLARHLERRQTRELAWWELRRELPQPLRALGPLLLTGALVLAVALLWAGPRQGWTVLVAAGFLIPLCVTQALSIRDRDSASGPLPDRSTAARHRRIPPELAWVLVGAVPLGVVIGMTVDLSLRYDSLLPERWEWAGVSALAMTGGLTMATALGVLGLLGGPVPATVPLSAGKGWLSWRRRGLGILVVAAAGAIGAALPAALLLPTRASVISAGVLASVVAVVIWQNPGIGGRVLTPPRPDARRPARTRGPVLPAVGRGMAKGVMAGFLLGLAFGVADGTVLSARASAAQHDIPSGGSWQTSADGRRVLVADGWQHWTLADGTRAVRAPGPIRWSVERERDGTAYAQTMSLLAEGCDGECETVNSPVELHQRSGQGDLLARLPDGTFASSWDLEDELPPASRHWLLLSTPGGLFGRAVSDGVMFGLSLGLTSGLTGALHRWLVTPTDVTRAGTPLDGLRADRATAISRGILLVAVGFLGSALWYLIWPEVSAADPSFILWLGTAPFAVALSAWGWLLVTRLWLCGTGRLPWRLMRFLEDAHRRGVLRRTGALYEFRHARLQERLAVTFRE